MMRVGIILICILSLGLLTACSSAPKPPIGNEILIPQGYELIDVSAYGKYENKQTFYCRSLQTDEIVICNDGIVGASLTFPYGYTLVAVSAHGQYENKLNYYCKVDGSYQVFECTPTVQE